MYWFLRFVSFTLSKTPDVLLLVFAKILAFIAFRILKIRREVAVKNIEIAFGDKLSLKDRELMAYEAFYHLVLTGLEFFCNARCRKRESVEFVGDEHIRKALDSGRGVYIFGAHFANIDAMGASITKYYGDSYIPVKQVGSKAVDRFVCEARALGGMKAQSVRQKGEGFENIQTYIKKNGIVGFFLDQTRPGAPKLPFFGRPAKTNTSLAAIWLKVPAPIVPAMAIRLGVNRHRILFFPEIEMVRTENTEQDILTNTLNFNLQIEKMVLTNPRQYFWVHKRWKN